MRRLLVINAILALTAFILIGCNESNVRNTNQATSNIDVVANSSMPNANMMNVNLPSVNSNTMTGSGAVTEEEKDFMNKAAQSNMAEIQAAQMALQKTQNPQIKQFAQKMIDDHTKAGNELKDLAAKNNVTLPTDVNADQKEMMNDLSKLSGKDFDSKYMDGQVDAHQKAVDLFQDEVDKGREADTKAFATKTLPTLKQHLEMAKSIDDKM